MPEWREIGNAFSRCSTSVSIHPSGPADTAVDSPAVVRDLYEALSNRLTIYCSHRDVTVPAPGFIPASVAHEDDMLGAPSPGCVVDSLVEPLTQLDPFRSWPTIHQRNLGFSVIPSKRLDLYKARQPGKPVLVVQGKQEHAGWDCIDDDRHSRVYGMVCHHVAPTDKVLQGQPDGFGVEMDHV